MMDRLTIQPVSCRADEIGRWLYALQQVRQKTRKLIEGASVEMLDWAGPDDDQNSIGTLLYHIAFVELSWIYLDTLQMEFPEHVQTLFPHQGWNDANELTVVRSLSVEDHVARLDASRQITFDLLIDMPLEEWHRPRPPVDGKDYVSTPEWVVFHLIEHEAGHAAQISSLARRWRKRRAYEELDR